MALRDVSFGRRSFLVGASSAVEDKLRARRQGSLGSMEAELRDSHGVSNTKNEVGGYSVEQAESHDSATSYSAKTILTCKCPGRG